MRYDQRYKHYTMPKLILENYLREVPLRIKDLTAYANHSYASLRVAKNTLRRNGRLLDGDKVDLDHAENIKANLKPLEDLHELPKAFSKHRAEKAATIRALNATANTSKPLTADPNESELVTKESIFQALARYFSDGGGGKDYVPTAKLLLENLAAARAPGPPAPSTDAALIARVLRVLNSVEKNIADIAIYTFQNQAEPEEVPDAPRSSEDAPRTPPDPSPDPEVSPETPEEAPLPA